MTTPSGWCLACRHYLDDGTCAAFPDGIPDAILLDGFDHRRPFDGDGGIRYEPTQEPAQ